MTEYINVLSDFCGVRDVDALTPECLFEKYGSERADAVVLFGGSIMCGGDVFAEAIKAGVGKTYVIVGGAGHTTETLREKIHGEYPSIETAGLSEAVIFNEYIKAKYGVTADLLETESTNCGNNITNLIALLDGMGVPFRSVVFIQDATMQRRMAATMRRCRPDVTVINYAAYSAHVTLQNGSPAYTEKIHGMWECERFVSLLMGEIARLTDNEDGYGPRGRGFIAHEDIPREVSEAFEVLKQSHAELVREANPAFSG